MPTTPHPEDPAEGSRETVDRELKRNEAGEGEGQAAEQLRGQDGGRPAGGESPAASRTQEQVQADIDAGRQGDKTPGFDPAAVPMEADAEAGGFSTEASEHAVEVEDPKRQNEASTADAMRPIRSDERDEEDAN